MKTCSVCDLDADGRGGIYDDLGFVPWGHGDCSRKQLEAANARDAKEVKTLRDGGLCLWEIPWIGRCGTKDGGTAVPGTDFCGEHTQMCSCGKPAVAGCDMATSLVCGIPTCTPNTCHRHGGNSQ